jgi:hypothetical protein
MLAERHNCTAKFRGFARRIEREPEVIELHGRCLASALGEERPSRPQTMDAVDLERSNRAKARLALRSNDGGAGLAGSGVLVRGLPASLANAPLAGWAHYEAGIWCKWQSSVEFMFYLFGLFLAPPTPSSATLQ